MKKFIKYIVICLVATSCFTPVLTQAKTLSQLKKEQEEIKNKNNDAQKKLNEVKTQQKSVSEEISDLDNNLSDAQAKLDQVEERLAAKRVELTDSQEKLSKAVKDKEIQFDAFSKRVKFIHENGKTGYLQVLLEAKSINDLIIRSQYVNDIMKYDDETLERLKNNEKIIEVETIEIKKQEESIVELVSEQEKNRNGIKALLSQKQAKLVQYQNDAVMLEKELKANESASNEVEKLIQKAEAAAAAAAAAKNQSSGSQVYSGGKLGWPVPGRTYISSGYVGRSRPIGNGYEFHTGLDIPAPYGYGILAAADGVVITAGWVNGYGNTVIISHGGGLSTLYGHNSSLCVSVGQKVTRGQVISKCGSTGNSTGNHCHFEVRTNGRHTNPWNYLK